MDFSHPPAAEQLRTELRAWLGPHLTADLLDARRRGGTGPAAFAMLREWNVQMADAGWAAVSWPREYGGRAATPVEQLVYAEETTPAHAPAPLNVIGINNIATAIMYCSTDAQQRDLLPRMRPADDIWRQSMSEPESGSDLASLHTRAVRGGDHFAVTGQKIWTSLGHRADRCRLYVRTDPEVPKHKGISCLVVDMSLPGVEARPLVALDGSANFTRLFFDEVRVPAAAQLGPQNSGRQVATTTLTYEKASTTRLYAELHIRLAALVTDPIWPNCHIRSTISPPHHGRRAAGGRLGRRSWAPLVVAAREVRRRHRQRAQLGLQAAGSSADANGRVGSPNHGIGSAAPRMTGPPGNRPRSTPPVSSNKVGMGTLTRSPCIRDLKESK